MSDLGQLGSTDQRVGLLQESPPGALVVVRAVMGLGVAVGGAEVAATSERQRRFEDHGPDEPPGAVLM